MTSSGADMLRDRLDPLALEIRHRHYERFPEIGVRYGAAGRARCLEDARFHLEYLAAALDAQSPEMFRQYVAWTRVVLSTRRVSPADLQANLEIVAATLRTAQVPGDAIRYVEEAVAALPAMPDDVPPWFDRSTAHGSLAGDYLDEVLAGRAQDGTGRIIAALDGGMPLREVFQHVLEPAQKEIGRLWQTNRISVAQEHYCTAVTEQVITQARLRSKASSPRGQRIVAICVGGEQHEVGLRVVSDLLHLDGFETFYLGANVPPAAAVNMCVQERAEALLVSATLPTHARPAAEVIRLFRREPALQRAKVIVGGSAFLADAGLWQRIGADAQAASAEECAALIERAS